MITIGLVAVACKKEPAAKAEPSTAASAPAPAGDPCAKAIPAGPLSWIHDDYAAALACAKARKVPLVLNFWAPWCHTCLSLHTTVFLDKSFAPVNDRFVFAEIDTDREENAAATAKYSMSAWPTFYVVDGDEKVLSRWIGAASLEQFHGFLEAGARAMAGGAAGADAHLLAADRALTIKDFAVAATELTAALAAAPADWPRRPNALVSLIMATRKLGDLPACLALAERSMGETGNAASATDFLVQALNCATDAVAPGEDGKAPAPAVVAQVKKVRQAAVDRLQKLLADAAAPLTVDDRTDAMANLRDALVALDRAPEARAVAEQARAMLDEAADKAPNPMAAMTFNWPRAEVYAFLERSLELVPALEKSVRDLPNEYDPPARLGWVYWKGGKLDEGAKWIDAAIKLVYGPRKVRLLTQRAEIAAAQHDKAAERAARAAIVKTLEALPAGQTTPEAIAKARDTLAALGS